MANPQHPDDAGRLLDPENNAMRFEVDKPTLCRLGRIAMDVSEGLLNFFLGCGSYEDGISHGFSSKPYR